MSAETTIRIPPTDVRTEAFADVMAEYPYASEVDSIDELPYVTLTASDDGDAFTGRVIGYGSSYRTSHINHRPGTPLPKGESCSGCRWTDTAIVRVETEAEWVEEAGKYQPCAPPQYVLITLGKSVLPGEQQRETIIWTSDPIDVLRNLFAPTKPKFVHDKGAKAIPPHNGTAFREAACVDPAFAALLAEYGDAVPDTRSRGAEADPLANL